MCYVFQGIINEPVLHGTKLTNWTMIRMPLSDEKIIEKFATSAKQDMLNFDPFNTPFTFWKGTLTLQCQEKALDTFLEFDGFTKGVVWVNGFNLGRYWPRLGPQKTLYVPGPVLKGNCTENTILLLEQDMAECLQEGWKDGCYLMTSMEPKIDGDVPNGY